MRRRAAIAVWRRNESLWVLGNVELDRLSIVSLVIRHGNGHLHWNYVVALLNDLFGIQTRGGCSCAGPYGHRLLGIDLGTSSVKLLLRNSGGSIEKTRAVYAEKGLDGWWGALCAACQQLDMTNVDAVSLSSQVGTYIINGRDTIDWRCPGLALAITVYHRRSLP